MCDGFIPLCTVAGNEGVVPWWCRATAATRTQVAPTHVHSTHADPKGAATTPHVHTHITSTCDVITHAVRACQGPWLPAFPWQPASQRAFVPYTWSITGRTPLPG